MALTKIGKEGITGISNSANANAITIDSGENVTLSGTLGVTGAITGTLATAAQTNITSVGTLTGFRSTGIDDNADALAITIDGSENVAIGGTTGITAGGSPSLTIGGGSGNPSINLYGQTSSTTQINFADATSGTGAYEGYILYGHDDNRMTFGTNHAERMRITSTNVGINTSSPTSGYMLHVGGSSGVHTKVKIEATTATGQAELDLSADPAGVSYLNLGDENSYNIGYLGYFHSDNSMRFQTNSAERMRITSDGKIGIGTTSPGQLLEINGASNPAVLIKDTTNNCITYMYSQDSVATMGSASNHPVVFNVNNGEKMRILNTGNVGIGTTSIEGKLTIGVNTAQSDGLYINNAASGGGELDLVSLGTSYNSHGAAGGEVWLYSPDNINIGGATGGGNSIKFLGNGATRMKVHADGNIDMPNRAFAEGHFVGSNTTNNTGWAMTVTASSFMTYQNNASHGHGLTVQKAGYYLMFGSSLYNPVSYAYIGWCVNGGQLHHWHSNHTIESNHDFVSSAMHYCNVGDHITMENSSATLTFTWGGDHSVFWVLKVT